MPLFKYKFMSRQGIKISDEEHEKIMELLHKGLSPRQMKMSTGRSANAIYAHLEKKGIKLSRRNIQFPPKVYDMADEVDYSLFPDSTLFSYKLFPGF